MEICNNIAYIIILNGKKYISLFAGILFVMFCSFLLIWMKIFFFWRIRTVGCITTGRPSLATVFCLITYLRKDSIITVKNILVITGKALCHRRLYIILIYIDRHILHQAWCRVGFTVLIGMENETKIMTIIHPNLYTNYILFGLSCNHPSYINLTRQCKYENLTSYNYG